ncbi:antibiotic biosynthesis monooxygenase [Roseobacter sp. YSTF-M11]|uniref:Antibiotic biosynthesis monooxygenase n=1 Tax=Roseobacter insulae TaxID=2859783 RepID=A0A9X1FXQ8_9RHOB|nr:putative quinol monooxygenase [Roseobacter insulae]MBW4708970.1 antibiotic biosynthesis monooxygenase [Roseobacter insulae]
MFAVVVTLSILPDRLEEFLPLMHRNATASLTEEPGCRQFDVATDPTRPEEVFLYELYVDEAAFQAHLTTEHFRTFDAATGDMIARKSVTTYAQVVQ